MRAIDDYVRQEARKCARMMRQKHMQQARLLSPELLRCSAEFSDLEGYAYSAAYHFLGTFLAEWASQRDALIETYAYTFMDAYQEAASWA
jgi:hypothetical protein